MGTTKCTFYCRDERDELTLNASRNKTMKVMVGERGWGGVGGLLHVAFAVSDVQYIQMSCGATRMHLLPYRVCVCEIIPLII